MIGTVPGVLRVTVIKVLSIISFRNQPGGFD